jgi:hypothetical protein
MKKFIILAALFAVTLSCTKEDNTGSTSTPDCGTYNGHQLYKGPQGGCYYINSNGNKTYVDASECDC